MRRRRRKRVTVVRTPLVAPSAPNVRWSMDFVTDALADGRRFRTLTIVDDFTRECPALEVDHALSGVRVAHVLDQLATTRGLPQGLVCDNGPEFAGQAWTSGPITAASLCCSSSLAGRSRMRTPRASTGVCGTNA